MSRKKTLPKHVVAILLTLAHHLAPPSEEVAFDDLDEVLMRDIRKILNEFTPLYRFAFFLGIRIFDWLPFLFGFGLMRFTHLSPALQLKYIDSWAGSRWMVIREFFKSVKGIVLLVYFSDKRVWKYLGYDVQAHVDAKILQRQELLKKQENSQSSPSSS